MRPKLAALSASDVIDRICEELEAPTPAGSPFDRRISTIRALQRTFREEPVGGRLKPLKRAAYWFTASAFDRQAKVVEALIEIVEELGRENQSLTRRLLRATGQSTPKDDSSAAHQDLIDH